MPNGRWGRWRDGFSVMFWDQEAGLGEIPIRRPTQNSHRNHLRLSMFRAFFDSQEDGWKIIFRSKVSALRHAHFNCPKDFSCLSFSARCWKCTDCKPDFVAFAINSLGVQGMRPENHKDWQKPVNLSLNQNCTLSKMWQKKRYSEVIQVTNVYKNVVYLKMKTPFRKHPKFRIRSLWIAPFAQPTNLWRFRINLTILKTFNPLTARRFPEFQPKFHTKQFSQNKFVAKGPNFGLFKEKIEPLSLSKICLPLRHGSNVWKTKYFHKVRLFWAFYKILSTHVAFRFIQIIFH